MSRLTSLSSDKSRIQISNFLIDIVKILSFTSASKVVFKIIIDELVGGLVDHNK